MDKIIIRAISRSKITCPKHIFGCSVGQCIWNWRYPSQGFTDECLQSKEVIFCRRRSMPTVNLESSPSRTVLVRLLTLLGSNLRLHNSHAKKLSASVQMYHSHILHCANPPAVAFLPFPIQQQDRLHLYSPNPTGL